MIGTVRADQAVVAALAPQDIGAETGCQNVVGVVTDQDVIVIAAFQVFDADIGVTRCRAGIALAGKQAGIDAGCQERMTVGDKVRSGAAIHEFRAIKGLELIVPVLAVELVVARGAEQNIVACAAMDGVVPHFAVQDVIA